MRVVDASAGLSQCSEGQPPVESHHGDYRCHGSTVAASVIYAGASSSPFHHNMPESQSLNFYAAPFNRPKLPNDHAALTEQYDHELAPEWSAACLGLSNGRRADHLELGDADCGTP